MNHSTLLNLKGVESRKFSTITTYIAGICYPECETNLRKANRRLKQALNVPKLHKLKKGKQLLLYLFLLWIAKVNVKKLRAASFLVLPVHSFSLLSSGGTSRLWKIFFLVIIPRHTKRTDKKN